MFRKASKSAVDCWLQAMKVKDCKIGRCPCADKLRQVTLHIPIDDTDSLNNNILLKETRKKYDKCYNINTYWQ